MNQHDLLHQHNKKSDKTMLMLHGLLFVVSCALAPWYGTWLEAIVIGGGTLLCMSAMTYLVPGRLITQVAAGIGLMVMASLHIQQARGMIEFHFGIFVLIALLLYYRNWVPVITAAVTIAIHHFSFFFLQVQGAGVWVLPEVENGIWVIGLHAAYVIVVTAVVAWMSHDLQQEYLSSAELARSTDSIIQDKHIDLTIKTSQRSPLLKAFDGYTDSVRELVDKVSNSSVSLHDTSMQLAEITRIVSEQSNAQHEQTDLIASAVEEMTASAKEVAANAQEGMTTAHNALTQSNQCNESSMQTETSIKTLESQIIEASRTITSLDKETNQIGSVLDVIRGIAEQTNLLALNAAIEAARAGEQGRGFAVVADEVRSLAQRTQQSTEEIDRMIEALQNGSNNAVSVIEASKRHVDECVARTHDTIEMMQGVVESIQNINRISDHIAVSANEQSQVSTEISNNLSRIVTASQTTNAQIEQASTSSSKIEQFAQQLDAHCRKFKT
ncbi:MAG: methyl-accepting chemotaxis protein [Pseudomonadota bacterium]